MISSSRLLKKHKQCSPPFYPNFVSSHSIFIFVFMHVNNWPCTQNLGRYRGIDEGIRREHHGHPAKCVINWCFDIYSVNFSAIVNGCAHNYSWRYSKCSKSSYSNPNSCELVPRSEFSCVCIRRGTMESKNPIGNPDSTRTGWNNGRMMTRVASKTRNETNRDENEEERTDSVE